MSGRAARRPPARDAAALRARPLWRALGPSAGAKAAAVALCGLAACAGSAPEARFDGAIMGTTYAISLSRLPEGADLKRLERGVLARMQRVDALLSSHRPDSDISRFNRADEGEVPVDPLTANLALHGISMGVMTDGAFDITIGPLVHIWGFGPMGETRTGTPSTTALSYARSWVNYRMLSVDLPSSSLRRRGNVTLDASGIAKGFAVDQVAEYLTEQGVDGFLVEIGGDLLASGANPKGRPWRIGIERPADWFGGEVQQPIALPDGGAVATSGDYRNFRVIDGRRYAHIISPRTGWPVSHRLASVTVVHRLCADADALATALAVMGPERGARFAEEKGLAAFFIIREGERYRSAHSAAFAQYVAD